MQTSDGTPLASVDRLIDCAGVRPEVDDHSRALEPSYSHETDASQAIGTSQVSPHSFGSNDAMSQEETEGKRKVGRPKASPVPCEPCDLMFRSGGEFR